MIYARDFWGQFSNIGSSLKSNRMILALLLIILLGSFLRIYDLGTESIWLDEAFSIKGSDQDLVSVVESSGWLQNQPPLYFVILHFWMLLFGRSEIAVRSLSAIFGIISIFLIYQVGCVLFNRKVGLISSFLSSISSYHIYYSQEARSYSLLLLLTLLSFFFFIKILKADNTRKLYFFLLFLANLCLAYTHIFGLLVITSQIFYFILFWNKYKQLIIWFLGVQIATGVFFSPWIPPFIERISALAGGYWVPEPSLTSIVGTIGTYAGSGPGKFLLLGAFFVLCLLVPFSIKRLAGKWVLKKPLESIKSLRWNVMFESPEEILLLLIWFLFPILIPFIISKFFFPIYLTRYTISASPALYLLVARGMSPFREKKALYLLVIVIALLSLPGLQYYYTHYIKEQWRETADFIEHNTQADEVIIIRHRACQVAFDYYYKGDLKRFRTDKGLEEASEIAAVVDKTTAGNKRLWLVLNHVREAPIRDYLIERYGSDSVILQKNFVGVKVYLFDLQVEPHSPSGR